MRSKAGLWMLMMALVAGGRCAHSQAAPRDVDGLKGQMKVFEAVVDGTMSQTFAPPFGLLEKTQGTYLPGFGLAFSLEVNLYPTRDPNPFDTRPLSKAELDRAEKMKVERIAIIKRSVPQLLADHAISLRDLAPNDSVAVVVHLFEMDPGESKLPSQLVIEARKSELDRYWNKAISYQQFVATIRILEL